MSTDKLVYLNIGLWGLVISIWFMLMVEIITPSEPLSTAWATLAGPYVISGSIITASIVISDRLKDLTDQLRNR